MGAMGPGALSLLQPGQEAQHVEVVVSPQGGMGLFPEGLVTGNFSVASLATLCTGPGGEQESGQTSAQWPSLPHL